jgi:glycosyltransferase involved in cell wall biosynthesis
MRSTIRIDPVDQKEKSISATVICPVRNMGGRLKFLEKWVNEISEKPFIETIIVHDYLDEEDRKELQVICSRYEKVKLIEGQFGNPGSARNAGLSVSSGKRVVFWDCDDEPNITRFLDLLKSEEAKDSDICVARFNVFNEITKTIRKNSTWSGNPIQDQKTFALNPGIWRVIFKKEILTDIFFDPLKMAEDQLFICQAMLKAKTISFSDAQIYTYFIGSSHHLTKNKDALQDLLPAMKKTNWLIRKNQRAEMNSLLNLMSARQLISGLKYGNVQTKLGLLASSIDRGFILRPSFVKALMCVLKNTVKG